MSPPPLSRSILLLLSVILVLLLGLEQILDVADAFSPSRITSKSIRRHTTTTCTPYINPCFMNQGADNEDEEDEDEEDDEDDEPPDVDVQDFRAPSMNSVVGMNSGRSAPSIRKAMGLSGAGTTKVHVCTNCGSEFVKWMGRCPTCREWNTLQEMAAPRVAGKASPRPTFRGSGGGGSNGIGSGSASGSGWLGGVSDYSIPVRVTDAVEQMKGPRRQNRIIVPSDDEFNNVLGGGIMKGSLILMGGDPGVGKSTLLLQIAGTVASLSTPTVGIGMGPSAPSSSNQEPLGPVWYVSGEETTEQIASRADRLGIVSSELFLLTETNVNILAEQVIQLTESAMPSADGNPAPSAPSLMVLDSIQTMMCDAGGASASGGVTQVRECVALLLRLAKSTGIPIILIGHVTKKGDVAGPRTVEHMVDTVLYLEGTDSNALNLRMLRASKNRFGSNMAVGIYEMSDRLIPVSDPSSLLLADRVTNKDSEGCAIALSMEGVRVMTVEVQALCTASSAPFGRRTVEGIASNRLLLLLGILQKHGGMYFGKDDVYINIVGNLQQREPSNASDLAVVVALVSSRASIPVRADTAFCGEVGLLGELRRVSSMEQRLLEASRMGFSRVVTAPRQGGKQKRKQRGQDSNKIHGMEWIQCDNLMDAINSGLVSPVPSRPKRSTRQSGSRNSPNSSAPGYIKDLNLDVILDDEDDEFDDFQ